MDAIQQTIDLCAGHKAYLDVDGTVYASSVIELHHNFVHLEQLRLRSVPAQLRYNQPVYLMQELPEGGHVFLLLRFMQRSAKGARVDIFRAVRSTFQVSLDDSLNLPMFGWCDLTVFSIFNSSRMEFEGKVQMYELSETGIGLIVPTELPYDTFAEGEFTLAGRVYKMPMRATYGISADNGAYHRMGFRFINVSQRERLRLRQYLFTEQARRLREA